MDTPTIDELGGSGRLETRHVRYPGASWTSFDRYSRYSELAGLIRANLGPGRHRVLDVGDASGYLTAFDAGLEVVSLDPTSYGQPLPGTLRIIGDGTRLPFRDRSFAAVISSDALEHVTSGRRQAFLLEAARVADVLVAVAAPFDTPGVAGAEELVRRFALLATGRPQEQLDEHRDYGLPDLSAAEAVLRSDGAEVASRGNGNLHDWVAMMLLKHQLMPRPALAPLDGGYDLAYNYMLAGRNAVPPFYRHVVAARRSGVLQWPVADGADVPESASLLTSFLTANITEVVRQDVVPALQQLQLLPPSVVQHQAVVTAGLDALHARLDVLERRDDERRGQAERVEQTLAELLQQSSLAATEQRGAHALLVELHGRFDTLAAALRHPLAALRRR